MASEDANPRYAATSRGRSPYCTKTRVAMITFSIRNWALYYFQPNVGLEFPCFADLQLRQRSLHSPPSY
jgi:hypothetical protein